MYEKASENRAQNFGASNTLGGPPPQPKSALIRLGLRMDSLLKDLHEQTVRFESLLDLLAGPIPQSPEKSLAVPTPQNQLAKFELALEHFDDVVRRLRISINRLEEI